VHIIEKRKEGEESVYRSSRGAAPYTVEVGWRPTGKQRAVASGIRLA
jgi:hypothetical protein